MWPQKKCQLEIINQTTEQLLAVLSADGSFLINMKYKVSWGYRQALLSHYGCHILPVPPDPFPAPLGCPLEKKWRIKSVIKELQPAQMAFVFYDWLTLCFLGKNRIHAQRRVPRIPSAKVTWQARGAPSGPRHPGETPCCWVMSAKLQPYSSQQAKVSTTASLNQLKSSALVLGGCSYQIHL